MTTTLHALEQKQARNAQFQNGMNAQHELNPNAKQTRQELLSYADDAHKEYPQYSGHWDSYELVRITVDVKTKAGQAFKAGDVALAKSNYTISGGPDWTVYSVRNGCDTRLSYGIKRIED